MDRGLTARTYLRENASRRSLKVGESGGIPGGLFLTTIRRMDCARIASIEVHMSTIWNTMTFASILGKPSRHNELRRPGFIQLCCQPVTTEMKVPEI